MPEKRNGRPGEGQPLIATLCQAAMATGIEPGLIVAYLRVDSNLRRVVRMTDGAV